MKSLATPIPSLLPVIAIGFSLVSCSTGPQPPAKGTPAFYWSAATQTYTAADYLKTTDHLEQIEKSDNEFKVRAQPWRLVLLAGIIRGHMELADQFEHGARANKTNPTPFRKEVSDNRTRASQTSLQFSEAFSKFLEANKDPEIVLAFPFPKGNAGQVPQLLKASQGMMLASEELDVARRRTLDRAAIMAVCRAAGAPADPAKATEMFKTGEVKVPRAQFLLAMAEELYEQSELFDRRKLDRPDRQDYFAKQAQSVLGQLPDSKEVKELSKKLDAAAKKKK